MKKFILLTTSAILLWNCSNSASENEEIAPEEIAELSDDASVDSCALDTITIDTLKTDSIPEDSIENKPFSIEGMLAVAASSKAVLLGTNDKTALESETPQMKVILDYDYLLARHETTCGEFTKVMKKYGPKESFANNFKCESNSLPIADVTYYDAVLFANARSRDFAESLAKDSALSTIEIDTVYDYTQISMDEEGHCSNLAGFMFHPERNGFRLPTEAE